MVRRLASSRIFGEAGSSLQNVSGLLVERAPGHDEDSRAPVLIKGSVAISDHFLEQAWGTPLDCSAISLILAWQTEVENSALRSAWIVFPPEPPVAVYTTTGQNGAQPARARFCATK